MTVTVNELTDRHVAATTSGRRVVRRSGTAVTVAFLLLWAIWLRPPLFGGSTLYVRVTGSSMLGTYEDGDLVITRAASTYATGDIVAYPVPADDPRGIEPGTLIIHRITDGNGRDGWTTQGDNRNEPDPWHPTDGEIKGRVMFRIPGAVDLATTLFTKPWALAVLAGGIMFAFVVSEPRKPDEEEPVDQDGKADR